MINDDDDDYSMVFYVQNVEGKKSIMDKIRASPKTNKKSNHKKRG